VVWKADFSEKKKKIYLPQMSFGERDIYTVELRYHGHPLDRTQLVVWAGQGWSLHSCIPKGFMYYRDHSISTILSL